MKYVKIEIIENSKKPENTFLRAPQAWNN